MAAQHDPVLLAGLVLGGSRPAVDVVHDLVRPLPAALGAAAAVLAAPACDVIAGSDDEATLLGSVQRDAGPLHWVLRNGRPLVVPDLTRVGPPALAAGAEHAGLTTCAVVPLIAAGAPVGALQLFGTAAAPVDGRHAEAAALPADVLAVRLVDLAERVRLAAEVARLTAEAKPRLAVVPKPRSADASEAEAPTHEMRAVARHRRRSGG